MDYQGSMACHSFIRAVGLRALQVLPFAEVQHQDDKLAVMTARRHPITCLPALWRPAASTTSSGAKGLHGIPFDKWAVKGCSLR